MLLLKVELPVRSEWPHLIGHQTFDIPGIYREL